MLTVDFSKLQLEPGQLVLDLGCGSGRHCFEIVRRGAHVVGLDLSQKDLAEARNWLAAMQLSGESAGGALTVCGDALRLPFPNARFDHVVISEVLEHVPADRAAMAEIFRVLKPGGRVAASVPRWWPEKVCWVLSDEYHSNPGGHVRIYRGSELRERLQEAGFRLLGSHHAHALHVPYWWLKCAVGVRRDDAALPRTYHRFLVWEIVKRPRPTRWLESALNPILGKSVVVYAERPGAGRQVPVAA